MLLRDAVENKKKLIYSIFAGAAARGVCTRGMVEGGVLAMMRKDPMLALVRQASADRKVRGRLPAGQAKAPASVGGVGY